MKTSLCFPWSKSLTSLESFLFTVSAYNENIVIHVRRTPDRKAGPLDPSTGYQLTVTLVARANDELANIVLLVRRSWILPSNDVSK